MDSDKIYIYLHAGHLSWFKEPALKLIQLGTDSMYYHSGVGYDRRFIVEATSKRGVDVRPIQHYQKIVAERKRTIDIYECQEEIHMEKFLDWLATQESKKYDTMGILKLAWLKLTVQRGKANNWAKKNDFFCSELIMRGLRAHAKKRGTAFADIPVTSISSPADIARSKSFKRVGTVKPPVLRELNNPLWL